jgi:hypothetical protein
MWSFARGCGTQSRFVSPKAYTPCTLPKDLTARAAIEANANGHLLFVISGLDGGVCRSRSEAAQKAFDPVLERMIRQSIAGTVNML